ncbi:predicted protein [Postia placenta Mad-698-R]|uniref:CCHC-type domain-containing protein n=1 Tax=Postia placenta MAD-698-R-SB12 TaxID=670580 RepID=A0A1X6MLU4_9APHY|nr:hypothetical protein POSPLADRAFT_1156685 [Postia placenta MAD-698-R-SB12]EED81348.1 predicted protein [Postia placenta Mad-698-R]OSX57335.1 hypothetical protein POSPLADRAFT_1156685 [Postia placenta MAD-698-R-SB12]
MATTGVAALPIAGTKSAPKKFTEKLASLLKVYLHTMLYFLTGIVKSLGAWREYTRGFLTISGWLRRNQRITTDEEALYFWKGIPRLFRQLLEPRLLTAQPNHDLSKPFVMSDVNSKAEALLQRNRFDTDRLPSDDEDSDDESSASESDSDSNDSSDSESEHDKKKRKQKAAKHKVRTKKRLVVKSEDSDNEEDIKKAQATRKKATKEMKKKANEVDDLVRQLNRMSLEDPDYGVTYLRACRLDPLVASVVRKPLIESTPPMTRPSAPMTSALRGNAQTGTSRAEMKCYGCGKLGHGLSSCPDILGLIDQGIIIRDGITGRLTMKDGSRIFRGMDEPFTTAIEHQVGPQSHFITAAEAPFCAKVEEAASEESDGDGDDEDEDEDSNTEAVYVMPVKPTEKIIRTAWKQAAQGPVVPPVRIQEKVDRAKGDKQKDKPPHMNESVERRLARIQGQPAPAISDPKPDREVRPVQPHTTRDSHERVWEHQQPVDTSQRNFDPANDDEIMEDDFEPITQKQKLAKDAKKGNKTDATPGKEDGTKRVPKKSDVQAQVDQMKILGKVLSTPVTLAVGEVFGISKEMSQHLQNVLKPKSPVVNIVASSFSTKTRGLLIRLRIEIDGRPIIAIVDTGSQLNIAHKRIWKTMLNRPMDIARSVNMNDANGGAGILQGLVENVPLTCGGVLTHANLYIGDKVPFDLLLGRPWQRGNYISIDERSDGTYLLFKDKDLEVRHEILVTPDGLDPNWSFDPAVWHSIQNSTQKGLLGQKDTRVLYCGDFREDYIYNSAYEKFWQRLGADLDEMEQQEQEEQTTSRESIQPANDYTVYQVQQQPTPTLLWEDKLLNDRLYVHDHSHLNEEPLLICGIKIPESGGDQIASPNSESATYEEPLQQLEIQKQKRKNLEANNWCAPGLVGTAFPETLDGGVPEDQYEMFRSNKEHTPVRTNEKCTHQVVRPLGLAPVCCGQEKQVVSCLRTPAEGARDPNAQLEESDRGVLGIGNEEYLTLASRSGYEPVSSDSNEVDEDAWQHTNVQAARPGNAGELRRNGDQYEPISQEDKSVPFIVSKELMQLEARLFALAPVHRSQKGATWIGREECYTPESERLIAAPPGMLSPLLRKDGSVKQLASTQAENEGDAENLPGDPSRERTPARANRWPWCACPGSVKTLSCTTHCSDTPQPVRASSASCAESNNAQTQTQTRQLFRNEIGSYLPKFSLMLRPQRAARTPPLAQIKTANKELKRLVMQRGRNSPDPQLVKQRMVNWLAHQRTGNLEHAAACSLTCHRDSPEVGNVGHREPIEGIAQEESRGRDQPRKEARVGTKEKGEGRARKRDRSANVVAERKVRRREAPIRVVHSIEICSEDLDTPDFALRALPDLRQASVPLASSSRLSRMLSLQVSSPEHPYHDSHDARRAPQQENARTRHNSASRQDAYPAECQNADARSRMLTTPPEIFKTLPTGLKSPSVKPAMPVLHQSTPYPSAMPPTQCYRLTSGAVGTVRFVPPTGPPPPTMRQSTGIQGDQLVLLGHHDLNVHGPANLGRLALGGNFTVRCAPQQTHLGTQQTFVVLGCVVWYTEPGESEACPYFGDAVITFTFRGPTETIVPFVHAYEPPPPPPPSAAIQTMSTTRNERPILPLPRRAPVPQERAQQECASHDIADVWLVENAAILGNILAASPSDIPAMLNARPLVPPPLSSSGLPSPSTPLLPVTTPDGCDIENLKIPGLLYPQDSTDADVRAVSPLKTNGLRAEPVQDEDEDMPSLDFLAMQAKRRTTSALYWSPSEPSEMQRVNTLRPSMSDFEDFGYLEKAANLAMDSTPMCCLIELENGETSEDVNAPLPWFFSSELEEDDEEIYAFTDFNVLGVYKRFLVYFLKMHEWNVDSQKTHCYHYQNCHLTRLTLYPERDLPETV